MTRRLERKVKTLSEKQSEKRLVTAALPYINNIPHLGHIVGSHLPADIFARYCRSKGYDTVFVGGTDEHGSTSEIAAAKIGVNIKEFSDKLHNEHKKIYDWFNISYDNFSRTSHKIHHKTVQDFFKKIYDNGFIKQGKMKVFYSPSEDIFLPDRYVTGKCPKCNYEDASGDQCERCTSVLDPTQLKNPRSTLSGGEIEIKETDHLFLKLDKLSSKLKKWILSKKDWRKQVTNLALGWINEGLKERCITRDLKYGVKVPLEGFENKVFYVWFEAPIGYVSSTKEARKDWESFWKDKNSKIYNFLGKDNIPFHTIFWPGMIIAEGEFNLPEKVIGLQYLNYEGGKFSKSKERGVFCEKLPELDIDSDIWRGYLTQIIPETNDSEFKWKDFQERVNSDLIGNYGNFINRTISFINNKFSGEIRKPLEEDFTSRDKKLITTTRKKIKNITEYLEKSELRKAFGEILSLSAEGNKYLNDNEPWNLIKTDPEKANRVMYFCANLGRSLAILSAPYLPNSAKKIWKQLNLEGSPEIPGIWDSAVEFCFPEKHRINKAEILFNQIKKEDLAEIKRKVSKPANLPELFR